MEFLNFNGFNFTLLKDRQGCPWWVAKELSDYLERRRDTLIRQVGSQKAGWHFFLMFHVKISFEYLYD
jgi:hypothetical protein